MGLRINQNLSAHTALNYVRNNDVGLNKAIERLSSGLRIVRGADDPAGLIISEKYRAQIDGLGQAMANSKDGINMVQTAEGALDEVSSILRNTRNLALHAANTGANDSEALAADQKQIKAALDTLDRIAGNTQFGSKKVLDGSAGTNATVTNTYAQFVGGTENTQSGTYAVNITTAAAQGKVSSNSGAAAGVARKTVTFDGAGATADPAAAITGTDATVTLGMTGMSNVVVNLAQGDKLQDVVDKINAAGSAFTASIDSSGANPTLKVQSGLAAAGNATMVITDGAGATAGDSAKVTGYDGTAGEKSSANATGASKLSNDELMTFTNGSNTVNVALTAGSTVAASVSSMNNAMKNAGIQMTASFNSTTAEFELKNDQYGSGTTVANAFSSNKAGTATVGFAGTANTSYNLAASGATLAGAAGAAGLDVVGTIGGVAATGKGQFLTSDVGTAPEGLQLRITADAAAVTAATAGSFGTVKVDNNSLKFQIGAFADETVKLSIDSVSTARMGTNASGVKNSATTSLADIDVTKGNGDGASDALKVIDAAISQVSNLRSKIGSFQKDVLESTGRNLSTAQQNIRASESNIRDADFAEEMLTFSRGQILSQTGFSMLTQANQSAQQVLKLFG